MVKVMDPSRSLPVIPEDSSESIQSVAAVGTKRPWEQHRIRAMSCETLSPSESSLILTPHVKTSAVMRNEANSCACVLS